MRLEKNTKLNREQLEISIVEMCKYVFSKIAIFIIISILLAVLLPCLKYISDLSSSKDMQNELNQGANDTTKLQDYINRLDTYEEAYLAQLE